MTKAESNTKSDVADNMRTNSMKTSRYILKTIFAMIVIMTFYFIAGAMVVVNGLEGAMAKYTQGCVIWLSVIAAIIVCLIRNHSLKPLGFQSLTKESMKRLYFFIPLLLIAVSGLIGGIDLSENGNYLLSCLFLTIGVGFSEEIYFRGIICNQWIDRNKVIAILISSVLFGICHMMNVLGGAGLVETILQVCFAFFYGIVCALIFIEIRSIWPVVILHFLHDFCSFVGNDIPKNEEIILAAAQTVLLVVYALMLWRKVCKE